MLHMLKWYTKPQQSANSGFLLTHQIQRKTRGNNGYVPSLFQAIEDDEIWAII